MKTFVAFTTLLGLVITAFADDYYDYSEYENEGGAGEEEPAELPKFLATPQSFSVEIGDEITLPCDVDRTGKNNFTTPLMFKFSSRTVERTIYVGDIKVPHKTRIRKFGNSYIIPNVKKVDAGEYTCRFETDPVVQLSHTLNVQFPARVFRVSEEILKVVQGSRTTLECEARGNPNPPITWSKKDGHLPSGAKSEEGLSITFEEVDRHVEGTYICTAANGIGEPSSTSITVEVEYKPEIISEQAIMNTGNGYQAELVCLVHGRPPPEVVWYRSDNLVSSEKHFQTHDGAHRHTLRIDDVTEADFGEYSCEAENAYGKKFETLYLTGLPKQPLITSSPAGGEKSSYTLTWTTETFAPIMQYRLKYKKVSVERSPNSPNAWTVDQLYFPTKSSVRETRFSRGLVEMMHPLKELEPAEDYEAMVQVENKFGWSPDSKIFNFFTRKVFIPVPEMAVGRSASGVARSTPFSLGTLLSSLVLISMLWLLRT